MNNDFAIIDASFFIKAHIPNPDQEECLQQLDMLKQTNLLVPALWFYEITSVLAKIVYFKQLNSQESRNILHLANALDVVVIEPDEIQNQLALDWAFRLNRANAYDCFYLAIAESHNVHFWTADKRLFNSLGGERLDWLHLVGSKS